MRLPPVKQASGGGVAGGGAEGDAVPIVTSSLGGFGWSLRMLSNLTCSLFSVSASIHRVTRGAESETVAEM